MIAAYRQAYASLEGELIALFPGALATIEAFHRAGATLAVATNKLTERTQITLERFGIADGGSGLHAMNHERHERHEMV